MLTESLNERATPSQALQILQDSEKGLLHTPCHNAYTRKKSASENAPPPEMYCTVCKNKRTIYGCRACKLPFCIVPCFHKHLELLAELAKKKTYSHSDECLANVDQALIAEAASTIPQPAKVPSIAIPMPVIMKQPNIDIKLEPKNEILFVESDYLDPEEKLKASLARLSYPHFVKRSHLT